MASDNLRGKTEVVISCLFLECDEPIVVPISFELQDVRWTSGGLGEVAGVCIPDYSDVLKHVARHREGTWTLRSSD